MTRVISYIVLLAILTTTKLFSQENETKTDSVKKDIVQEFIKKSKATDAEISKIKENTKKRIEERIAELKKQNALQSEIDKAKQEEVEKSSQQIAQLKKELVQSVDKNITEKINNEEIIIDSSNVVFNLSFNREKRKKSKRTETQVVFAAGINNVIQNGQYGDKDFRLWGSHFYEVGFTWNTRVLKDNNLLHFKYGISGVWNNLRPTNNRIFEVVDGKTQLISVGRGIDDSRFRNVQIIFPMHLELDFSKNKTDKEGKPYFRTHKGFRMGVGGFLGFRSSSRQHIEYEENGHDVEIISKEGYRTNDFIYGVSGYIGFSETSLYVKYDLNPLFRNSENKMNNISLGVRFDLN